MKFLISRQLAQDEPSAFLEKSERTPTVPVRLREGKRRSVLQGGAVRSFGRKAQWRAAPCVRVCRKHLNAEVHSSVLSKNTTETAMFFIT